jgi:hypothetical protein
MCGDEDPEKAGGSTVVAFVLKAVRVNCLAIESADVNIVDLKLCHLTKSVLHYYMKNRDSLHSNILTQSVRQPWPF